MIPLGSSPVWANKTAWSVFGISDLGRNSIVPGYTQFIYPHWIADNHCSAFKQTEGIFDLLDKLKLKTNLWVFTRTALRLDFCNRWWFCGHDYHTHWCFWYTEPLYPHYVYGNAGDFEGTAYPPLASALLVFFLYLGQPVSTLCGFHCWRICIFGMPSSVFGTVFLYWNDFLFWNDFICTGLICLGM